MKLSMSQTREKYPLSEKKIIKKTISRGLVWLILFGTAEVILAILMVNVNSGNTTTSLLRFAMLAVFMLFIVILVTIYLYQRWYFAVYYYDLSDDYVAIRKGPITPKEITIPFPRLQDVYVDQDLLDRIFGIYDVHISSATASSGMEAHIDGVDKAAADGLRSVLLSTISRHISKKSPSISNTGE